MELSRVNIIFVHEAVQTCLPFLRKLDEMGSMKQLYDTAKVMNIMLQHEGHKMSFRDVDGLLHVGVVSAMARNSGFLH